VRKKSLVKHDDGYYSQGPAYLKLYNTFNGVRMGVVFSDSHGENGRVVHLPNRSIVLSSFHYWPKRGIGFTTPTILRYCIDKEMKLVIATYVKTGNPSWLVFDPEEIRTIAVPGTRLGHSILVFPLAYGYRWDVDADIVMSARKTTDAQTLMKWLKNETTY
jgi:hypothetical protein